MIAKTDFVGIATLVTAVGAVLIGILSVHYGRGTKQELKTFNDQSVGQQISAATSARYVMIPVEDRNSAQVQHLLDVPPDGIPVPVVALEGNPPPPEVASST